jgi:phage-related holin
VPLTLQAVAAGAGALKHQYETKINIEVSCILIPLTKQISHLFLLCVVFDLVLDLHTSSLQVYIAVYILVFSRRAAAIHAALVASISVTLKQH